ncbi:hypothetical protein [Pseudomonas sp. H9]|uniref:hypothetical protein n=1 Tax=Pseudomonas sp. H9 TaxID=483968 RepID=UPI001057DF15|nr:hypothetical protein [Pseudomonas sp. H9]TDF78236.1 hypothetical protein E1573_23225 [Pseudomonas sp. H9]
MNELTALHEAITASVKLALPVFETVEAYVPANQNQTPALPALIHAITGLKPSVDPGDGRSCIMATFEARILVDSSSLQAPSQAVTLAAQVAVLLRKQFWGLDFVEEARLVEALPVIPIAAMPDAVEWRVQWEQALYLGSLQWPWPNEPGPLAFAFSPDTGPGHEGNYQSPEDMA